MRLVLGRLDDKFAISRKCQLYFKCQQLDERCLKLQNMNEESLKLSYSKDSSYQVNLTFCICVHLGFSTYL